MQGRWRAASAVCCFQPASLSGFTDVDLYCLIEHKVNLHHALVKDVMAAHCKTIYSGMLAAKVMQKMDSTRINALPAVKAENELLGALDMHDLLRAGVV